MVEDDMIVGRTNKQQRDQEAGETQKERELKMIFSQLKTFFLHELITQHILVSTVRNSGKQEII